KEGISWAPASGGKAFVFGNGAPSIRKPGATIDDPDFQTLDKLKAGNVLITTPSIRFVFGKDAKARPIGREGDAKPATYSGPAFPDGVVYVAFPPGTVRMEAVPRGSPKVLRVTVGKTIVDSAKCYLGDDKGVGLWDA